MTSWVIATTRTYSDMDGLGNPFVDGDSFTGNSGCRLTANQHGKAGANCTLNDNAYFYVSAGVSALFNNGGSYTLTINEGARCYLIGTSGNNAVIGGDAGQDALQIVIQSGGILTGNYATIQYISTSNSIHGVYAFKVILKNCTFSHLSTYTFVLYAGFVLLEDCVWGDYDTTGIFNYTYYSHVIIKNCTMKCTAGGFWLASSYGSHIDIIGNTTIDKSGAGPVEPNDTNDAGIFVEDYRYYSELVLSEGNSLASCSPSLFHDSIDSRGKLVDAITGVEYDAYLSFPQTDGSGGVNLYPLRKVFFNGVWKYWSDSGEAESGDNQKFTIGLVKDGYVYNTTTAWADAGTASITLSVDNQIVAHPKMFNQGMN